MATATSAFVLSKVRYNVSLSPCHITEPRVGIEQEMTALLMRHSEPLGGVVLAFSNVRLAKPLGHIINEMPYIHCKVLADALVFQPREGMVLRGVVNKIGSNHIGMLFAGVFNGSVAATELPQGFVHNYAQDAWLDGNGNSIGVNDTVDAKVLRVHVAGGMIAIEASMRSVKRMAKAPTAAAKATAKAPVTKASEVKKEKKAAVATAVKSEETDEAPVKPVKKAKKPTKKAVEITDAAAAEATTTPPTKKKRKATSDDAPVVDGAVKKVKKKKTKKN